MDSSRQISFGEKYDDLIQYFSSLGNGCTNFRETNLFTQVRNNNNEVFLQFRIEYPRDVHGRYIYTHIQVSWKLVGLSNFSVPHRFKESTDQRIIFEIIMFEIISWKLQNMDKLIVQTLTTTLNSETISDWLKTKEEQIRMEERAKIESHLSVDEFRKVISEELGKISINLKIGDK